MVSPVTFRSPALTIKAVTSLDTVSGGRAWFGAGAGHSDEEAQAMGLDFPEVAARFERLEETVQLAKHMWSGERGPFEGRHYHLSDPVSVPPPISTPHPPILIGGMGEHKTLRMVAQYADACNLFDFPNGEQVLRHKLDVLAQHCADVGRPVEEIQKTLSPRLDDGESADSLTHRCESLGALGIEHVVVITPGPWTREKLANLYGAAPRVADLTVAQPR